MGPVSEALALYGPHPSVPFPDSATAASQWAWAAATPWHGGLPAQRAWAAGSRGRVCVWGGTTGQGRHACHVQFHNAEPQQCAVILAAQ